MEPILRAEKLTKRFGELTANREIDIEIHAGEIHAIAGENGAGKSTLMKMLYGVYQPTAGNLYIDGEKMERWNDMYPLYWTPSRGGIIMRYTYALPYM